MRCFRERLAVIALSKHLMLTLAVLTSVLFLGGALSCAVETKSFSGTSSTDAGHSHIVNIVGADVDQRPAEKQIDIQAAGEPRHTHTIKLTSNDFNDLKYGREVKVTTNALPDGSHTHGFVLKKS